MNKTQSVAQAIGAQVAALDETQGNKMAAYVADAQAKYTQKKADHASAKADFDAAEAAFEADYQTSLNATKSSMDAIVSHLADNADNSSRDSVGEAADFLADRSNAISSDFADLKIDESAKTAALIADIGDAGAAAQAFLDAGIDISVQAS